VRAPSGQQFEIAHGDQHAVVVEVGGGLRSYTAGGRNVIEGYGVDEMARAGRGQVLLPWPNRLQDGIYEFDGERYQLALTEPEHGNAIHGLVSWTSWQAREQAPHRVVLQHVLHPQPGYPFTLEVEIAYELGVDGLNVQTTATNVGEAPCPYGCGAHPYLTVGTESVDDIVLQIPARTALRSDARGIPTGTVAVDGTELDFRTARKIAETKLDNGYTDLERDEARLCRVELATRDGSSRVTLWVDESYPYLMVFTGDRPDVQRRGLAVEPMTCPPNSFRSGQGLIRLDPGASVTTGWGIATG
jgi:aldose 1-epimerase